MKRTFKNKLKMFDSTINVVDANSIIIANLPALIAAHVLLKQYRIDIEKAINVQIKIITGITKDKKKTKLSCANIASKVAKALAAYAHSIENGDLFDEFSYSKSELEQMQDEILIATAENISSCATTNATLLVDFGVDTDILTSLTDTITKFKSKKVEPKAARDARKDCTAILNKLFPQTTDLLKNEMDKLVDVLDDDACATFKALYKSARNIIDYNGPKQNPAVIPGFGILLGNVANSEDNSVIEDATISIVELNLSVQSDENGDYYFESVPVGTYTLKISAPTYLDTTLTDVEITKDSEVSQDVALEPDESGNVEPPEQS